jgi:hypothetical protein
MNVEVAGNLVGRLLMSWFIVFIVTLLMNRGNWRSALRGSVWPWGWIFVLMLFVMGILGTVASR